MIGVIASADESSIVEEFFQLFKTPWEFHQTGRRYDVVVATGEVPEVDAGLLIAYGSDQREADKVWGSSSVSREHGSFVTCFGFRLPIYGNALTFEPSSDACKCATGGVKRRSEDSEAVRIGYDLFEEIRFLLAKGQPLENAHCPTLDLHIALLRECILSAGIELLEIPPIPAGYDFAVCLTHDIDFVGIRDHLFDHSMLGFLYRSTVGGIRGFLRGRISLHRLLKMWRAVAATPFVFLGWIRDFWEPFEWYLNAEKGLPATYFLIPYKKRVGERVPGRAASHRAASYDIADLEPQAAALLAEGCEIGVHGIDSWHSVERGRDEQARIAALTRGRGEGIRMHWLLRDENTFPIIEAAGYKYDSTFGYNETIGYRAGTSQVFRPLATSELLELPLHIQDGALFYQKRLDLSEAEAWRRCVELIETTIRFGGVLTVLWHDRSHGPERFWGEFYIRLLDTLKSRAVWFGTGSQVAEWFRNRRRIRFERVKAADGTFAIRPCYEGDEIQPALRLEVRRAGGARASMSWNGVEDNLDSFLGAVCTGPMKPSAVAKRN